MAKEIFSVSAIVNNDGCFDLQFRKDTRSERTNAPTYYRWKAQFVVTAKKEDIKILEKIKREIGCGEVSVSKDQARFSVQKIGDVAELVVPFFRKNQLANKKKHDFEMWSKARTFHFNRNPKILRQIQNPSAKMQMAGHGPNII